MKWILKAVEFDWELNPGINPPDFLKKIENMKYLRYLFYQVSYGEGCPFFVRKVYIFILF